jgi:hypothetical protein
MDPLEMQSGMGWIIAPQLITLTGLLLDSVGELGEASEEIRCELGIHS